jgi:hypothetical protein
MLELSTTALQIGGSTGAFWNDTNKRLGIGTNSPFTISVENAIVLQRCFWWTQFSEVQRLQVCSNFLDDTNNRLD